ncbi:MAG: hypothetical protein VB674_03940 [Vicinamibacterales bacterium]
MVHRVEQIKIKIDRDQEPMSLVAATFFQSTVISLTGEALASSDHTDEA